MTTTVKHFHSAMTGAPTLSGVAGTLIAVLDACLVDGFNLKTADSVVVADGVATFSVSTGVGAFEVDTIALIAGATPSGLNGEKRLLSVTANAVTFDATGISNQTATGTITAKLAPAGWSKAFSGTNLAVYRSADVTGTRFYLRVDDTGTTNARVVAYEAMTDVNTGTFPFPTAAQMSGGYYWPKANAANGTARGWTVIADTRTLWQHLHTATSSLGNSGVTYTFGDFNSYKSGDAYACHLSGHTSDQSSSTGIIPSSQVYAASSGATIAVARSYTGLGTAIAANRRVESYVEAAAYSGNVTTVAGYPNGPDNSLLLARYTVQENTPLAWRGVMRGPMFAAQNCGSAFGWRDKVATGGRKYMAIKGAEPALTSASPYVTFFDITGPW